MLIRAESSTLHPKPVIKSNYIEEFVFSNSFNSVEISQRFLSVEFCGFTFCVGLNISHVKLNTVIVSCPLFSFLSFKLQSASEYEERKLIRAAIRRLRDEEIRGEIVSEGLEKSLYTYVCVCLHSLALIHRSIREGSDRWPENRATTKSSKQL